MIIFSISCVSFFFFGFPPVASALRETRSIMEDVAEKFRIKRPYFFVSSIDKQMFRCQNSNVVVRTRIIRRAGRLLLLSRPRASIHPPKEKGDEWRELMESTQLEMVCFDIGF